MSLFVILFKIVSEYISYFGLISDSQGYNMRRRFYNSGITNRYFAGRMQAASITCVRPSTTFRERKHPKITIF